MMTIVQKKMNVERSICEMLQIVSISLTDTAHLRDLFVNLTAILSMNLMIQPNQICLIVKLYNYRPELLPDSNDLCIKNDIMIIKLIELNNFILLSAKS